VFWTPLFHFKTKLDLSEMAIAYNEMTTYEDQSFRRERHIWNQEITDLRAKALVLLREALYAANLASRDVKVGDPDKVWKMVYEAVIASAPIDIRKAANILRNHFGGLSKY
jgi:hypothetical protein